MSTESTAAVLMSISQLERPVIASLSILPVYLVPVVIVVMPMFVGILYYFYEGKVLNKWELA